MNLSDLLEGRKIDIPEVFKSHNTKLPMARCIQCEKNLLEEGRKYMIEKAVKKYDSVYTDVLFEYAICMDCADEMRTSMSKESTQNMKKYFSGNTNFWKRNRDLLLDEPESDKPVDINLWISNCMIKGTPVSELGEYQIFGYFEGEKLLVSMLPYVIGEAALEEMESMISAETRGEMDDFIDEHFGLPPEWKKALKKDFVLV